MSKAIASSWGKVFESDLFASFQQSADKAIIDLLKRVEASCLPGLKERAAMQSEVSMNQSKLAMEKITGLVHEALQSNQREISRSLVPHVQSSLTDGYESAMEERGRGSVARQKASFHDYVSLHKDHIFTGGAETVMSKLNAVAEAVGVVLQEKLLELAEKVHPFGTSYLKALLITCCRLRSRLLCSGKVGEMTRRRCASAKLL